MPDAPGATLCARFRSWAAAGDVARLICKEGGGGRRPGCWAGGRRARAAGFTGPGTHRGLLRRCRLSAVGTRGAALPVGRQAGLREKEQSVTETAAPTGAPAACRVGARGAPYLLHGRQALELGAGEVLLLQGGRLQHQVLLLRGVHLLQVLRRRVGLPVQRLLDHLRGGGSVSKTPTLPPAPSMTPGSVAL